MNENPVNPKLNQMLVQLQNGKDYYGVKGGLRKVTLINSFRYFLGFKKEQRWESIVDAICREWDRAQVEDNKMDKESMKSLTVTVQTNAPKLVYLLKWRLGEGEKSTNLDFADELANWKEDLKQKKGVDYSERFKLFNQNIKEFPVFAGLIKEDVNLRTEFFRWSVLYGNLSVKKMRLFIEHPGMYRKIKECYLAGWIGKAQDSDFELKDKKIVLLKFDGEQMLDLYNEKQKVTFGDYTTTVKKVVECLHNKQQAAGDFIFVRKKGFIAYNSYKGATINSDGNYEPIYKKGEQGILEAIPVVEVKTLAEIKQMFPEHADQIDVNSKLWINRCTKENMQEPMDVMKTHAMTTFVMGDGKGKFHFRHFGHYPASYPTTKSGQIFFTAETSEDAFSTVDENFVYEHRAHALDVPKKKEDTPKKKVRIMTDEHVQRLRVALTKLLEWNYNGQLPFQFLVNGCGRGVEDLGYLVFGERDTVLRTSLTNARPGGILQAVIRIVACTKKVMHCLGMLVFYAITGLLGGGRSRMAIRIPDSFPDAIDTIEALRNQLKALKLQKVSLWKLADRNLTMYHPGMLFNKEGVYQF